MTSYSHDQLRVERSAYPGTVSPHFAETGFTAPGKACMLAAYALMNGIDLSEKVDDKNKQLNDAIMKIQMVNLFSARHKDAINALMKLQFYGITEDQILKVCRFIEANGHNLNPASRQASC